MSEICRSPRSLREELGGHPALRSLAALLGETGSVWLVGGALRDGLLGRSVADFDFALPGDPTPLARKFAGALGGSWFMLDEERRQSRVVLKGHSFDFAPFRGADLPTDLALRDFTVNALAMPLGPSGLGPLEDPLRGLGDLEAGRLHCCSEGVLEADPLRVLKGVRHVAALGLAADDPTRILMARAAPGLSRVAPERVGREFALLFRTAGIADGLRLLAEVGVPKVLLDADPGAADLEAGLAGVGRVDRTASILGPDPLTPGSWQEWIEGEFTRESLVRLAAWLRGCGLRVPGTLHGRLSLGRSAGRTLASLLDLPGERCYELEAVAPLPRSRALWAAGLGPDPVAALVLLAALAPGIDRTLRIAPFLAAFLARLESGDLRPLLDGRRVQELLGRPPGPKIGQLLERLRMAEIEGRVRAPEEAENFLKSLEQKGIDSSPGPSYNQDRSRE